MTLCQTNNTFSCHFVITLKELLTILKQNVKKEKFQNCYRTQLP